jgi:hypothetical protein
MDNQTAFAKLRNVLAELYPDETSARVVVDDAGLDPALISFSSQARNNWHDILTEARNQGKTNRLLTAVLRDYGENRDLQGACAAYRSVAEQGSHVPPLPQTPGVGAARGPALTRTDRGQGSELELAGRGRVPGQDGKLSTWFSFAGAAFGALTLLFFMGLVAASLFGYQVPLDSRFSVIVVLALGSALATSFLGGWAVAEGRIPIPLVRDHPLQFSAGGGTAVLILVLLLGYWIYAHHPDAPASPALPSVVLMDSKESRMIYDPAGLGTNTDDIRDILRYLSIKPPMEELVYAGWDDAEILAQLEPDLIIIHHSAFYTSTIASDPAKRLGTFLWAMEDTRTKFLIYSRTSEFSDEAGIKAYYEKEYPFLEGRVDVLWVPEGMPQYCSYWQCSDTRERLRRKVKSLLGLP